MQLRNFYEIDFFTAQQTILSPSVLWHCWLGCEKIVHPRNDLSRVGGTRYSLTQCCEFVMTCAFVVFSRCGLARHKATCTRWASATWKPSWWPPVTMTVSMTSLTLSTWLRSVMMASTVLC